MARAIPIVQARKELGRIAEEVARTGRSVILTRRGKPVARITPEASDRRVRGARDPLGALRGTLELNCTFDELNAAIRGLRRELTARLDRPRRRKSSRRG